MVRGKRNKLELSIKVDEGRLVGAIVSEVLDHNFEAKKADVKRAAREAIGYLKRNHRADIYDALVKAGASYVNDAVRPDDD